MLTHAFKTPRAVEPKPQYRLWADVSFEEVDGRRVGVDGEVGRTFGYELVSDFKHRSRLAFHFCCEDD